ncbi:MAG: response regulator [Chloroflexota bacterium]|nr:response regulator [Chloroflexota bacterium]
MITENDRASLETELRATLSNLYDPAALRDSRLMARLGLETRADAIVALRRLLLDTIESLKPADDAPAQSRSWRYYHILYGRYTEQLTQFEVGNDLGLSVRQLRRQEKRALAVLADKIWMRYKLASDQSASAPGPPALGRDDELAWSQSAFSRESVEVDTLIRAALDTAEPMLRSSAVEFVYKPSEGPPKLALQLVPTRQALLNILTVALDWLDEGRLVVRAEHQPGDRHVSVSVRGYGSLAAAAAATGAERLSVARELIGFSGGSLHHDSDSAGDQVCEFRLTLPTDAQITVLAIDDNPDTLQLLQRYTTDTRYRLQCESDPARSLALAQETLPDIILLDVLLQDIDGWELLGRFRAHPQLGDKPVIVCTILPQRDLALSLGAAGFLSKPLSQRQLLAALDAQLDRARG